VDSGGGHLDHADRLVPGHDAGPVDREVAVEDVQVRPAHPARQDPDAQLVGARLRVRPLDELEPPGCDD
jgi:hypothetical protein